MTKQQSFRRRLSVPAILIGIVLLVGAYQLVMMLVRNHVDGLISEAKGRQLVSFELPLASGGEFSSASFAGKVAILNFFRSKCVGCRQEAPVIKALFRRIDPEKVVLLGVMMDRVDGYFSKDVTQQTLQGFAYEHPIAFADHDFVEAFHGAGWKNVTPITYIADAEGKITHALRGHQQLEELLQALPQGSLKN